MSSRSVLVRVPATVGSFAGARGCAALALDALLNVKVTPRNDDRVGIRYFGENGYRVPRDRSNLTLRALEAALQLRGLEFSGADLEIYSSVPVAVGLGSSTAAVLAGLIAADRLYSLELDEKTLFEMARVCETRMDNLLAAWHGGFVAYGGDQASPQTCRTSVAADFLLSVVIPMSGPETRTSRDSNPHVSTWRNSDSDLRLAQNLANYFMEGGKDNLPELDAQRQSACREAAKGFKEALKIRGKGALGVFVCGSGPGVGILTREDPDDAIKTVRACFLSSGISSTYATFHPTNQGAREWNSISPQIVSPSVKPGEIFTAASA